jgi:ATP-dependent protease Clp ATPase subunit
MARALAHVLGVPFAEGNPLATSENPEIDPLVFSLLEASGFDAAAAGRGVLFVDGLDREEIRRAILDLWPSKVDEDFWRRLQVDVEQILLVFGAQFAEGVPPDLIARFEAIARVDPLDESTLERVIRALDFDRLDGDDPGDAKRGLTP